MGAKLRHLRSTSIAGRWPWGHTLAATERTEAGVDIQAKDVSGNSRMVSQGWIKYPKPAFFKGRFYLLSQRERE